MAESHAQRLESARQVWDAEAQNFDNEPDHGLRTEAVRAAWLQLMASNLPTPNSTVLDIGCGTGSLSLVLAELGCAVTGIDVSPAMLEQARAKTAQAGYALQFHEMDAAFPQFAPQQFDVLLCRHLLWMLPDPAQVLERWVTLLKPRGRLLLIEGYWHTQAGLHAQELLTLLPASLPTISVQHLSANAALWGKPVEDERYLVRADLQPAS